MRSLMDDSAGFHATEAIALVLMVAVPACATNNDCGVFQVCMNNVCVANNQGCNPACVPPQVCIAPNCVAPPPVATTTTAPGASTTTGEFDEIINLNDTEPETSQRRSIII
ncbi:hypothetical protein Tcan_18618 [Toxocara canis]|uniref:WAP domain-containing protein n=1 Tax=Toxocara canis TaxID=6265 RepID=A0A0B2UWE8_TOXCA|nr:hypothetical protein Tcan_18618 [Toxocara canis]